jgi:hypothetical protein
VFPDRRQQRLAKCLVSRRAFDSFSGTSTDPCNVTKRITPGQRGALGGIRTPNLLIRRELQPTAFPRHKHPQPHPTPPRASLVFGGTSSAAHCNSHQSFAAVRRGADIGGTSNRRRVDGVPTHADSRRAAAGPKTPLRPVASHSPQLSGGPARCQGDVWVPLNSRWCVTIRL